MNQWLCRLLVGSILAGMGGCGTSNKMIREHPLGPGEILSLVAERNAKIRTLQGDGLITVESPEGSHNGSFDVRVKKPDSLKLEFHGPFGVDVGTLLLSRRQFVYYNKMDNTATIGKPDGKTLRSMFRLKMQFEEVLHAFTGEFPAVPPDDTLLNLSVQEDHYVLRFHSGDGEKEYTIDGESFIVIGYRVIDASGDKILEATSSRIRTSDNIPAPRLVRVTFPKERRSVTIAFDDITLNQPTECSFQVPKQAEVINRE